MRILTLLFLLFTTTWAHAEPDLVNCLFPNGLVIQPKLCNFLRASAERDAEKARAEAAEVAKFKAYKDARAEEESARQRDRELANQRRDEEARERGIAQAAQAKVDEAADKVRAQASERRYKEQAEQTERESKAWARAEAVENARLSKAKRARMDECGADFGTPRIGMSLARAQRCVGDFTLISEINRVDGVVATYRYARLYLNVMRGSVVSWHRF